MIASYVKQTTNHGDCYVYTSFHKLLKRPLLELNAKSRKAESINFCYSESAACKRNEQHSICKSGDQKYLKKYMHKF
jgi:hypothetical protein